MKIRTLLLAMVVGIPFFSCTDSEDIPQQASG